MPERIVSAGVGASTGGIAASLVQLEWESILIAAVLAGAAGLVAAGNRALKSRRPYPWEQRIAAFLIGVVAGAVVFLSTSAFGWDPRLQLAAAIMAGVGADAVLERGPFAWLRDMSGGQK